MTPNLARDTSNKNFVIAAMIACFSMLFLDESGAVGVTFPAMQQALALSNSAVQWVMSGFLLTAATLLLLGGKLADHYGRLRVFSIGLLLFLIASAVCGLAENGWTMILGRVLQAIGVSLVYPSGGAIISMNFPDKEFSKAYGTIMGFSYFFVAFGPFVGGLFTDFLNWRWLFLINIPLSLVCLAFILAGSVKETINPHPPRLDIKGLLIFIIGLGALIFALMEGDNLGWFSPSILGLFIIAAAGLALFVKVELQTKEPLLEVRLFRSRGFMAGNIIFPCTAACFAALIFWAIWLQQTFNYSPVIAGVAMIPATVVSLFMLRISGAWGAASGPRAPMLLGAILLVIGIYWIALSSTLENYAVLFWGFLLFGFGTPLIIPNSIGTIMSSVKPEQHGLASGVYLTLQHVAFSVGFAVLAAVINTYNNNHLTQLINSNVDYKNITLYQIHLLLSGKNTISTLDPVKIHALKKSAVLIYTHAFAYGMAAIGLFAVIALLFTIIFVRNEENLE